MCACGLCVDRLLRGVHDSPVFAEYCRRRRLPVLHTASGDRWNESVQSWTQGVADLPEGRRSKVDRELEAVRDLSGSDASAHLLSAAREAGRPPRSVREWGPVALWFLVHRHALFWEVFYRHESREVDLWHAAQTVPGLHPHPADRRRRTQIAKTVGAFFGEDGGGARHCSAEVYQLPHAVCFSARLPGRRSLVGQFGQSGVSTRPRAPAAVHADLVYYPHDGTILLQSPLRSIDRVEGLLHRFTQAALGVPIESRGPVFALDRLKSPFHAHPDGDDMEMVRVKALHLRYPARAGRRSLKLETLTSDTPSAIDDLLRAHVRDDALSDLRVSFAELQVRLRVGGRGKNYSIRLWSNSCDVGKGLLGDRFLACLRGWRLRYEPKH
jgi:hypothetical protein